MNGGLAPVSQRSPFHSTTICLLGMLLCVFSTIAVLMSVSSDQSGASLSEVTGSFSGSLRDHGRNEVAFMTAAFRGVAAGPVDVHADNTPGGINASRSVERHDQSIAVSEEGETGLFSGEKPLPTDVNGPVFSHLMKELQRYCSVSPAEQFGGQLALDLHSQVPQSGGFVRVAIERILKTCQKADVTVHQSATEFEVIVWASTPATEALAAASEDAFTIGQKLERSLKAQHVPSIKISSSGRIWTRPESPRPLATVIVRTAKR